MVLQYNKLHIPKFIQEAYILLISASLILHVFNELEISENLKAFHVPAALACLIVVFFFPKRNNLQLITYGLSAVAVFSSALSPYDGALTRAVSMSIVLIGCSGIVYIQSIRIIKFINWIIPVDIAILYLHLFSSIGFYRYTGFYNDPNYLCTTLLVFVFVILEYFLKTKRLFIRCFLFAEILLILILAAATLSRTGIVCLLLVLIAYSWELITRYKFIAIVLLLTGAIYMTYDTPELVSTAIEGFNNREDEHGNLSRASKLRFIIAMKGINYVATHPWYWLQGLGLGATGHLDCFDGYVGETNLLDHNTITSTFSETGIIGFVLMINLFIITIKQNLKKSNTNSTDRLLRVVGSFSLLIFCLSINQLTYLPFWWMMYLLNNRTFINENTEHYRLRAGW